MNEDQFIIERADAADAARLAPVFEAYRAFYGKAGDAPAAERFLRDRLEQSESVVFIAVRSVAPTSEPIGFTQLYPSFSSVSLCRAWILNDLFVAGSARSLGVGRALVRRAIEHCRETGARQLWLQTDITNTTAQRLYDSVGMTRKEILEYTLMV